MNRNLTRSLTAAAAVAMIALTGACSGGAGDSGGAMSREAAGGTADFQSGGQVDGVAPKLANGLEGSDAGGTAESTGGPAANRTVVQVRAVIKTGEIAISAKDLGAVRSELDGVLVTLGGTVDSERTTHNAKGDIRHSTLVIRVPVDKFDTAMSDLDELGQRLGTVKHSDTASKDVTTEVIDIDERVQTLQNSLNRLQSYQRTAADIADLIRFEEQITQRQSELQSLRAQQAYLDDQTSMSTISVDLSVPPKHAPPSKHEDDNGFLAGLRGGWNALTASVVVVLTVVGALLPFAVLLGLVGVPVWLLVRRTLRGRPTPAAPADAPGAPPAV